MANSAIIITILPAIFLENSVTASCEDASFASYVETDRDWLAAWAIQLAARAKPFVTHSPTTRPIMAPMMVCVPL